MQHNKPIAPPFLSTQNKMISIYKKDNQDKVGPGYYVIKTKNWNN